MEMINLTLLQPFFIALFLGALLGFERSFTSRMEHEELDFIGGIRTYALVSLFGSLASFLGEKYMIEILLFSFLGIIILIAISYYISYSKHDESGITTEVSMLICFLIGVTVQKNHLVLALFIAIVSTAVLYLKRYMQRLGEKIENEDIRGTLLFALVTFVILIFDPDYNFYMKDIVIMGTGIMERYPGLADVKVINPFTVWLMVVLISAIGFSGYIAIKILGSRKGIGLTGFLGGIASSTATTLTFSKRSGDTGHGDLYSSYALAVLLACSTMFPKVVIEVLIINASLVPKLLIVMGLMTAAGFSFCFFLWKKSSEKKVSDVELKNPFNLMPAVKFGIIFALIIFIARIMEVLAGDGGVYVVSFLSGLADVDPITLTMSQISRDDPTKVNQATVAITIAAFSNTIMKAVLASILGSKKFRKTVLAGFSTIICAGIVGLILVFLL
ncbi:MAG TPA: MgtC/SapB family protein [Spirochaetota bacterium]|nr:MgtC/SapB family protein [Spirochaetota bacterium]